MSVRILGLGLAFLLIVGPCDAGSITKKLAPGITLTQEIDSNPQMIINVLTVDLRAPGVRIGVEIGGDQVDGPNGKGREEVSAAAQRHGAVAAVNGDFFAIPSGDPLGIGIRDGELFSEPWWGDGKAGPRAAMGVVENGHQVIFGTLGFLGDLQMADGTRARLNGIDRQVGRGEIVAFTPAYGPVTGNRPGGTEVVLSGVNLPLRASKLMTGQVASVTPHAATPQAIGPDEVVLSGGPGAGADFLAQHAKVGERVEFVPAIAAPDSVEHAVQIAEMPRTGSDLPSRAGENVDRSAWLWATAQDALGGGPRLLTNGSVTVDGVAEGFDNWLVNSPQPRTAVGASADGQTLYIVTVDGRQALSKGVTVPELAAILKRYGAWDAINLDGGGSTAMDAGDLIVSNPAGTGAERAVAETLEVFSSRVVATPTPAPANIRLAVPANTPITVGSLVPLSILDGNQTISGASPAILWQGPASGIGFVDQAGQFVAIKPGTAAVTAIYKGALITGQITVVGTAPAPATDILSAQFAPGGTGLTRALTIRILDQNGKPLANAPLTITVTGGHGAFAGLQTNADGYAATNITWDSTRGGSLTVASGTLALVTVAQPAP
jgi:hypothetical protein